DHFNSFTGAGGPGGRPGLVRREDLEAVKNGEHRAELKSAAGFILDTPGLFDALDDAAKHTGRNDGWIALDDARAHWNALPPADRAGEKAELRKYSDDLIARPGAANDLEFMRRASWEVTHRDGKAALNILEEHKPADHAKYDPITNIRRGDESYFLT